MFEKILLPLDGSELAEKSLPYGEELAGRLGSELILLHVRSPEHEKYEHMHQIYLDRMAENMRHNISRIRPDASAIRVMTRVETGEPRENICSLVEKNNIGLIIMISVGSSSSNAAKMLGSVTDHICRTVPIPVLLVRPGYTLPAEMRRINRILLPLDGSQLSQQALPVAEELAARLKIPMTLFQMAQLFLPYGGEAAPFVDYDKYTRDEEKRINAELMAIEKELKGRGLDASYNVSSGTDAALQIIEMGKKTNADLVVMSTHGRSGLGRWVLGSVAEKVLRHVEIPLLLVHTRLQ